MPQLYPQIHEEKKSRAKYVDAEIPIIPPLLS